MWQKIKDWFTKTFDINADGKVSAEDMELAKAIAEANYREANEKISEVAEKAEKVAKKVKKATKKK